MKTRAHSFRTALAPAPIAVNAAAAALYVWTMLMVRGEFALREPEAAAALLVGVAGGDFGANVFGWAFRYIFVQASVTAVMMFSFTAGGRASTMYLSLPITRGALFGARYFAGLALSAGAVVFAWAFLLLLNFAGHGLSGAWLGGWLMSLGAALAALSFMYSVACLVCLHLGTLADKFLFSWAVLVGLVASFRGVANIFRAAAMPGNAMGAVYFGEPLGAGAFSAVANLLPPGGAVAVFTRYNLGYAGSPDSHVPPLFDAASAGALAVLAWLALAALAGQLARRSFAVYPAEYAGVRRQPPWLEVVVCVLAVYSFLGLADPFFADPGAGLLFALFAITMVVAAAARLALVRRLGRLFDRHGLATYGIVAGVWLFGVLFGLFGGFGYSSWQPDPARVERAQLSFRGAPEFVPGDGRYRGNYLPILAFADSPPLGDAGGDIILRDFSDLYFETESDILKVIELHGALIGAGRNRRPRAQHSRSPEADWLRLEVRVRYHMRGGRVVDRLYREMPIHVAVHLLLGLHETDAVRARMAETTSLMQRHWDRFPIYATDIAFAGTAEIPAHGRAELLLAMQQDIDGLSVDDIYFPAAPARVLLHFPRLVEAGGRVGQPAYAYFFANGAIAAQSGLSDFVPFRGYRGAVSERCMHWKTFHVTDAWPRTLALLSEMQDVPAELLGLELGAERVVSMHAQRFQLFPAHTTTEPYFRSWLKTDSRSLQNSVAVPQNLHSLVLRGARTSYFAAAGGYRIYVDFGGRRVVYFLPERLAPDDLRRALQ